MDKAKTDNFKNGGFLLDNIGFAAQPEKLSSLMLMLTYNCQMDCSYCQVVQKDAVMDMEIAKQALALLFTSKRRDVQLRFFGGEPLLYPKLVLGIMEYGETYRQGNFPDRKLRYMVTTNGINLEPGLLEALKTHDAEIMLSIDGADGSFVGRRLGKGGDVSTAVISAIDGLNQSGIRYFANMLVSPENIAEAGGNFRFLADSGIKRIQVGYETGRIWIRDEVQAFLAALAEIKGIAREKGIEFMNLVNECEPVMLSDELITDVDGAVYYDIAMFHEKSLPRLRQAVRLGELGQIRAIDELFHTKDDLYGIIREAYRDQPAKQELIDNNVMIGLTVKDMVENMLADPEIKTETFLLNRVIRSDVTAQKKLLDQYGLEFEPYFLHITNPCENDCVFCMNKPVPKTSLGLIRHKLKSNRKAKLKKLCLVGNEPLAHPGIFDILDIAREAGFSRLEIMSSGRYLKNRRRLERLLGYGLESLSIPIYSASASIHDRIVGRGGDFEEVIAGLENSKKAGIKLFLHTNLITENIGELADIRELAESYAGERFITLPIRQKTANRPYAELMPSYSAIRDRIREANLVAFPLCVAGDLQTDALLPGDVIADAIKLYLLDQNFYKPPICRGCRLRKRCAGTFRDYTDIHGDKELKPIV